MSFVMIVTESVPPRLRGRLSLWLVEVRAGVYVGNVSKRTRESLWALVTECAEDGNAVIAWPCNNEAGYDFLMHGDNRRRVTEFEGFKLVAFAPKKR